VIKANKHLDKKCNTILYNRLPDFYKSLHARELTR